MNLTDQKGPGKVISVPKSFDLTDNPSLGEMAEKAVFDAFKGLENEGYKMVIFSDFRFTGDQDQGCSDQIIREIDLRSVSINFILFV